MADTQRTCGFSACDRISTTTGLCRTHQKQKRMGRSLTPLRSYGPRPCNFEGCGNHVRSRGLCPAHYAQVRKGKALTPLRPRADARSARPCGFADCDRLHHGGGYCERHLRLIREGKPLRAIHPPNRGCDFEECPNPHDSKGLCSSHGKQRAAGLELTPLRTTRPAQWSTWNLQSTGYVARWKSVKGERIYQAQHRYVMEQHLGRPLRSDESVHHRNGDKSDNRLENLELWSRYQPAGQRVADKVAWAREILALYEPENPARS